MASKDLKERVRNRPKTSEHSVRNGFTMLKSDTDLLQALVDRYNEKGARTCKAEVIRLAIRALAKVPDEKALEILCELPKSSAGPKPPNEES